MSEENIESVDAVQPQGLSAADPAPRVPQQVLDVDEELLKCIESVLFAAGKKVPLEDIAKLCNRRGAVPLVEAGLRKLQERYSSSDSSLMVVQDGPCWKLTVRERFMPFVRKIVTQTELKKTVMETLAVIAYKAPMLQSDLIKIRTNKAYDHLDLLEEEGYIVRKKQGRTKQVTLAPKFFEYFDLPEEALRVKFQSVQALEAQLEQAEKSLKERKGEIEANKARVKAKEEEEKAHAQARVAELERSIDAHPVIEVFDEKGRPHELEEYDEKADVVDEPVPSPVKILKNRLGDLDIVSTASRVETEGGRIVSIGGIIVEAEGEEAPGAIVGKSKTLGVKALDSNEEAKVDRRVSEILGRVEGVESSEELLEKTDESLPEETSSLNEVSSPGEPLSSETESPERGEEEESPEGASSSADAPDSPSEEGMDNSAGDAGPDQDSPRPKTG